MFSVVVLDVDGLRKGIHKMSTSDQVRISFLQRSYFYSNITKVKYSVILIARFHFCVRKSHFSVNRPEPHYSIFIHNESQIFIGKVTNLDRGLRSAIADVFSQLGVSDVTYVRIIQCLCIVLLRSIIKIK